MKLRKVITILFSITLSIGLMAGNVYAKDSSTDNSQVKKQGKPIVLHKTKDLNKDGKLSKATIKKDNKYLERLKTAYEKGGIAAVNKVHRAHGDKEIKKLVKAKAASYTQSNVSYYIDVWYDTNDHYYWEESWNLGYGTFENDSSNVHDVVGMAITQAQSPFNYLTGWEPAAPDLQKITVEDENGNNENYWAQPSFNGFTKWGPTWQFKDMNIGVQVGQNGYAVAELVLPQSETGDFMINADYTHNWYSTVQKIDSISWGVGPEGVSMSVTWSTQTIENQWDNPHYQIFSYYTLH